ncbi:hypothetical protein ACSMXM_00270 [Pacificimonas sp. ICDLI1SI03]
MPLDLDTLKSTPDIREVAPVHAGLVCALRYNHMARRMGRYSHDVLAQHLGSECAVRSFHVFLDEAGRAWPEPIALNPPCQPLFSYDEMLLVDIATAAGRDDRDSFDNFVCDMIGEAGRTFLWTAARRLMKSLFPARD